MAESRWQMGFRVRTRLRQIAGALVFTTAGMMLLHAFRPSKSFVSDPMGAAMHHGPGLIYGKKRPNELHDVWDDDDDTGPDVGGAHWNSPHQPLPHDKSPPVQIPSTSKSHMPSHVYRDDGLECQVGRQSRHLADAVDEYEKRYGRPPPPNFDKWWDYVTAHNVQLPDEYDIFHDLEPLWGIAPDVLRETQRGWEDHDGTYTLTSENGKIAVGLHTLGKASMNFCPVPTSRATFTAHDGPYQFISWELKEAALKAAKTRTRLAQRMSTQLVPRHLQTPMGRPTGHGSPPRRPTQDVHPRPRQVHGPMRHPDLTHINGFLAAHGQGAGVFRVIVPAFSMCTTPLHSDIRTIPIEQFTEDVGVDPAWNDKPYDKVLWRGSNTGILFSETMPWNLSQRARLIKLTNEKEGVRSVLRPLEPERAIGKPVEEKSKELNERLMDVAFAGSPIQCEEPVCTEMKKIFEYRGHMGWSDANKYKYIMDIDGNGWSARFKRLMTTNSMILKTTIFPEWYMDRVMPWVHYVPVKVDLTDLYDIITFFRGDAQGRGGHDELAGKIGLAGKVWSKTFYRKEDMVAYLFRSFSSGTTSAGSSPNEDDYDPNEPTARGMMNYSNAHGNSQFRDRERGKVEERRKYEERKRHDQENQVNQDQGGTN
ncbi:glycosyltransferase family 90 protein [Rhizoctonia solani]|uniref:Glycosyltransferase family 90 protein n=1 Tax=Rhizoctonia solani TaxID=456999 RepID=A0A8H8NSL1_9AGAM|nr:glycosyltransferase family 90 protein [Rhizoctonia solani]QRW17661.1 glycosyltransferase family 90 protein [Rhizoctonia solani]